MEWKKKTSDTLASSFDLSLDWLRNNWFRLLFLGVLAWLLSKKDLMIQLRLQNGTGLSLPASDQIAPSVTEILHPESGPGTGNRQLAYVEKFSPLAREEMRVYGIPASIKLAQALLEANAGTSPLAIRNNNHFGIKCFSKTCKKGHCSNFSDDSHKDFFRIYPTARDSYRSHSLFLRQGKRYAHLFDLKPTDYRAWARGLADAGYATDKRYANKLIRLIEQLKLHRFDS